jgi:uncharacterized protein YciU (UPF0263 family)
LNAEYIDAEKILGLCEDIFFELAHENIDEQTKNLIDLNKEYFFIEIQEGFSDWEGFLQDPPDYSRYLEVKIFLKPNESSIVNLAFILIPADFKNIEMMGEKSDDDDENNLFHIRWH